MKANLDILIIVSYGLLVSGMNSLMCTTYSHINILKMMPALT